MTLSPLTASEISNARLLTFAPITTDVSGTGWDNLARFTGLDRFESQDSIFRFDAKEGATYDIFSSSGITSDPLNLSIHDSQGNLIELNSESDDTAGTDIIFDWVAPHTGVYYVDADWINWTKQENESYWLSIYEDIETVTSTNIAVSADTLSHLTSLGITVQQANDFITSHVNEPTTIYNVAKQNDVTTLMLSEITGFSTSDISAFFASHGLNAGELDASNDGSSSGSIDTGSSGKRDLLSPDMAVLGETISFNNNSGVLSTAALKESIVGSIGIEAYNSNFNPSDFKGYEDGVFTPEEFGGISHLGNIPATTESLESLFYGTAINAIKNFSLDELFDLTLNGGSDSAKIRELEINAYSSPTSDPFYKNDTDIAFQIQAVVGIVGLISSDENESPPFLDGILFFV